MPQEWNVERVGAIAVAAHHNPPMNYLSATGAAEFSALIEEWRDPLVRVVVLCGDVPGRFITHYSVEELVELSRDRDALVDAGAGLTDDYHAMLQRLNDLPKPIVCALNGDTMGGGFEITLSSDVRIGERGDYRYGFPEVKLGILPGGTGTQRLSRLIGAGNAIEFILRGRIVTPEEALAMHFVHELADDSRARAMEVAEELAQMPPVSMAMVKRAVYTGVDLPLFHGNRVESDASYQTRLSNDAVTAMQHYVEIPPEERRDYFENGPFPEFTGN
jgi:enoyl-CoA hydratase/carnithine racemase